MKEIKKIIITILLFLLTPILVSAEIVLRSNPNYLHNHNRNRKHQQEQIMMQNSHFMETLQPQDYSSYRPFGEKPTNDITKTNTIQKAPFGPPMDGAEEVPIGDVLYPLLLFTGIYLLKNKKVNN